MDADRLAKVAAAVASGTATGNDVVRAVACAGLNAEELSEVLSVLQRSADLVGLFAESVRSPAPRLPESVVALYGVTQDFG